MSRRRAHRALLVAAALSLTLLAPVLPATAATVPTTPGAPAAAATPPAAPALPATVAADALPTVQIDGVVWAQVVVGTRVYATGSFATARPAGAVPGTSQTPRANLVAYDVTTGRMVSSWNPALNAQGLAIAASPDGRRVYVGGDFTVANGQPRQHVAAFDADTGALLPGTPAVNSRVRAIAPVGPTVYLGGDFTVVGGLPRTRLAAFAAADGAPSAWAPAADREVFAAVAPAGAGTLVVGGRFATLSGTQAYGLGALDLTTGAVRPFAANAVVRDAGADAAIYDLSSDGDRVYGTGYVFGPGGNLENAFAADARTGALAWVNGCRGDTYSAVPVGDVLYAVGHPHDCSMVGANPEVRPRAWQRAQAMTAGPSPSGRTNSSGDFSGLPAPEVLGWTPTIAAGTYTGQHQGGWSVAAGGDYVVVGGEFPKVNGTAQQGLVRFAARSAAPNRSGPDGYTELRPTVVSPAPGQVSATTRAAWDRDDPRLTYELLRGSGAGQSVVATQQASSAWWDRPRLTLADPAAPGGTQTYRVRVSDPSGNAVVSAASTVAVTGAATPPPPPAPPVDPPPVDPPPVTPGPALLAGDSFERGVGAGLGSADVGGAWTLRGPASAFSVSGGAGRVSVGPGLSRTASLDGLRVPAADVRATLTVDRPVVGGSYAALIGRRTGPDDDYRLKLRYATGGAVTASLVRRAGGGETLLADASLPAGTAGPGTALAVRLVVSGDGPVRLRASVAPAGGPAPTAWLLQAEDSTAALAAPGGVGVWTYLTGSAPAQPVSLAVDDLAVRAPADGALDRP